MEAVSSKSMSEVYNLIEEAKSVFVSRLRFYFLAAVFVVGEAGETLRLVESFLVIFEEAVRRSRKLILLEKLICLVAGGES